MLKFVIVSFAVLAVALAANFDYIGNDVEYDVAPNMFPGMPYAYHSGYRGNKVVNVEPVELSPAYAVLAPEEPKTELVSSKIGLVASAAFYAIACVKKAVWFFVKNWFSLILGSSIALGVCKLTPLCNKGSTLIELQKEIRSIATPQRLARAAEMVEEALRKYNAMQ